MNKTNKIFKVLKLIQRTMERIFDHAVLIGAAVLLLVYILQLSGVLSLWQVAWLVWRGGW